MHTIIPRLTVEDRARGLGSLAWWWIERFTVLGDGGNPDLQVEQTPEYAQFIMNCYALDASGRRRFNHVFLSRPKGCDKSGKGAVLGLFEALGPCRFDHWAEDGEYYEFLGCRYWYEPGEAVGRPVQNPQVACLATSEDQTSNVYARMLYNCQYGPLSDLKSQGLDPANTRINLPDGGWIRPYAANAKAADGGLETFSIADETHLYVDPKIKHLYETVERNLTKRSIDSDPWMLETTTMYRPGEGSVAEETYQTAWDWHEGRVKRGRMRLYFDHRYAALPPSEFSDEGKVMRALCESYGSAARSTDGKDHIILPDGRMVPVDGEGFSEEGFSLLDEGVEPGPSKNGWQSMEDVYDLLMKPTSDPGDSIRYYLNNRASTSDAWLDEAWIESHTVCRNLTLGLRGQPLRDAWRRVVSEDDEITLGFDGSVSDDSTALVGCRVRDGLLFLIRLDAAPDGPEKAKWRVDREAFDGQVRFMFDHYNVVGMFADPAFFEGYVAAWEADYDGMLRVGPRKGGAKIPFYCSAWKQDVFKLLQEMRANFQYERREVGPDDEPDPSDVALFADPRLTDHFRNARMRPRSFGYLVFKETPNSPRKIDAMMAGLLAYGARQRYLAMAETDDGADDFIPEQLY